MNKMFLQYIFVVLLLVFGAVNANAQYDPQVYGDTTSGLYVNYKVMPKENLFLVGKKFGLRYEVIAQYNNLTNSSVSSGQDLKIPVTRENFVNQDVVINNQDFSPVIHVVQAKEGLYRIGTSYYRTPIQLMMKWNNLTNYSLKLGQRLIVGYLKSKTATLSYIGDPNKYKGQPYIPPIRTEGEETAAKNLQTNNPNLVVETGGYPSSTKPAVPSTNTNTTTPSSSPDKLASTGGSDFFLKDFNQMWAEGTKGQKESTVKATVFNSNTGWNDNKYYAMSSKIPSQAFVKITNTKTQQSIYVKVLGGLPAKFKDQGYELIISSAGAARLGLKEGQVDDVVCTY